MKKRASIFTKLVIAALIIYASVTLVSIRQQIEEAESARDALSEQFVLQSQENAGLQYDIDHADDPKTIEGIARRKLGLVMPNEEIFFDVRN